MTNEIRPTLLTPSDETTEKFKSIIKSNGILDEVSEVQIKDAGLKGEGFASQTHYVTITFNSPSVRKPLNLFVKTETTSESHTKFLEETRLFGKEAMFFMKYIPAVRRLCDSKGLSNLLDIYPKCYYADDKWTVFENLKLDKEYELFDRTEQHDFEAARLALITCATHHAISYSFIQESGMDEFIKAFPNFDFELFSSPIFKGMIEPSLENSITFNIQIVEKSSLAKKDEVVSFLRANTGKVWDVLVEVLKNDPEKDKILVLNHRDYHSNNMMFLRDSESKKLVDHKAIDLQTVKVGSPMLDICNYLYSSVKPEVRSSRLKDLLETYLGVLNSTTAKLGHPVNLTYEQLFQMYRQKVTFGIWFSGLMTANSALLNVVKEFDITKIDMQDFAKVVSGLIQKWLDANPEACEKDAIKIETLVKDYQELVLKD